MSQDVYFNLSFSLTKQFDSERLTAERWVTNEPDKKREELTRRLLWGIKCNKEKDMLVNTTLHCGTFDDPLLPLGRSNILFLHCYWPTCRCQQCETVWLLLSKRNNGFPLHWCRAKKYLILLSTIPAPHRFLRKLLPKVFSDFNQILEFSTDFYRPPPNKRFSQKSF